MKVIGTHVAFENNYLKFDKVKKTHDYVINTNDTNEVDKKTPFDTKFSQSYLIQRNLLSLKKYPFKNGRISFGKPVTLPIPEDVEYLMRLHYISFDQALSLFNKLKHAKYTDTSERYEEDKSTRETERRENKAIRAKNFSFLDCIDYDKYFNPCKDFVENYIKLTGFPNLKECSQKIEDEFKRTIGVAEKNTNKMFKYYDPNAADVIMYGYDGACSVGLAHAWPGSDLDKAFVIIKGSSNYKLSDEDVINEYRGQLWENMDTRILSVNHYAAFPNVYTKKQVLTMISILDRYTEKLGYDEDKASYAIENIEDPIERAQFNLELSKILPVYLKEDAKNFAYLIEPIRECTRTYRIAAEKDDEEILNRFHSSKFYQMSNMAGLRYYMKKYKNASSDELKPKLKAREKVEKHFKFWESNFQYYFIKNVIKNMCDDGEQDIYFQCPDGSRALKMNDMVAGKIPAEMS